MGDNPDAETKTMDEQEIDATRRARRGKFIGALALTGLGAACMAVGFAFGLSREGDAATGLGVLAGIGAGLMMIGAAVAWLYRPGAVRWMTEGGGGKRDRLQAQRSSQLLLFIAVGLIFLALAVGPTLDVLSGRGRWIDGLRILLPVLYAWVMAAMAMGWDHQSRKNRRYLEDELTVVLRARAMTAAFVVLMIGATTAFAVGFASREAGAIALLVALTAAGATAAGRFVWLDREAGRDG